YHIYTVDRHLLQTVAELRRLEVEEEGIFAALAEPELLYLAALFHDLGKGSGMDHSVYGAEVVIPVGSRLGLDREGCDSLSFLVRYHLFFPENALRRDLNDQDFIRQCSEVIGDVDRLAMLYLLSIADSRATGPSAWSDWKGTLLHEMFLKVRSYLEVASQASGAEGGEAQLEQGVAWLRQRVAELLGKERGDLAVPEMGDDYLLSFTPEAVVDHIRRHVANENILRQKVVVVPVKSREGWSLLVLGRDRAGLLAKICGVLALYDLNILNAEIFTWGGGEVVDLLELRPTVGTESRDRDWQRLEEDLNLALAHRLGLGHRLYKKLSGRYGTGRIPSGRVEPRVEVRNDVSATYTVVEVFGEDRPGCLYHITQALADFGINIHKAFIATEVEQLIDVFYVLDDQGGKIDDKGFVCEIKEGLLYAATVSI
ncbi:MAG: ACT domain-containing protein, partial [Thermodesulfobacteriota bacterium]